MLSGGSFTTIDVPGSSFTAALGINDTGQIVGIFLDASGTGHGFLLSGGILLPSMFPASVAHPTTASTTPARLWEFSSRTAGFLLSEGSFTTIDVPGSSGTQALGINDTGQIVGNFLDASEGHGTLATLTANATLWIGLENSDDQGTQFDLLTEVYKNDDLVAEGLTRCITGVTRNPNQAKEVAVPFDSITGEAFESGDELSLTILTRIGTNPDGTKCPGHNNAVGLRLYYDAVSRPARVDAPIIPDPFFLHSDGNDFLDDTAPTATTAKFKDSPSVNFAGGNLWKVIGTWSMTLP